MTDNIKIVGVDAFSHKDKVSESSTQQDQEKLLESSGQLARQCVQKIDKHLQIIRKISEMTIASDKLVRLSGSILKFMRMHKIVQPTKVTKLTVEIGYLRRLLRLNRLGFVIQSWIKFIKKKNRKSRDYFDSTFRILMFITDVSDMLVYLMQMKVVKERCFEPLRKIIMDFYFYQCFIWVLLHSYEWLFHQQKFKNEEDRRNKLLNIIKYSLDAITSHNDWSRRCSTIDTRVTSTLGVVSSIISLGIIWK